MPLEVLLPALGLLAAAVAAHSEPHWLLHGAHQLCQFERPSDARCSLQTSANETCQVHKLPPGSCFENWHYCRVNISFMENINFTQEFDEDENTTTLKIYDYKGTRFLVITMLPEETWWQVDVPKGEHNITITGLPNSFDEIQLIDTVYCEGCPPPRVSYIAYRHSHKFEIIVSTTEEQNPNGSVSVYMASTNESDFIGNNKCNDPHLDLDKEVHGKTNERLMIREVFGTEFCFLIKVNWKEKATRYRCSLQKNMTELPFHPIRKSIALPVWWVAGTIFLVILLALASVVPLAIRKGLWRRRRRRSSDWLDAMAASNENQRS